jgi:hypothetical protein
MRFIHLEKYCPSHITESKLDILYAYLSASLATLISIQKLSHLYGNHSCTMTSTLRIVPLHPPLESWLSNEVEGVVELPLGVDPTTILLLLFCSFIYYSAINKDSRFYSNCHKNLSKYILFDAEYTILKSNASFKTIPSINHNF